jgi:MATE family multidrug resistance protein
MLGSAAQNVVALSDSVFLYHLSEVDFASIGFVGVFYLIVAAIGFGFSKGGQILIARRMGEGSYPEVSRTFYAMLYFELLMAIGMFLFMQYGCAWLFKLFVRSDLVFQKSMEYLHYRSWGVFFSYVGVALIALYTGIARPMFILVSTAVLAISNIILNYLLIFGHFGFPAMGIAGAGLASTLSEILAFAVFVVYMVLDKKNRLFHLGRLPSIDWTLIRLQLRISSPIIAQAFVGLGSWFIFFGIVENLGERELAISNLVRMVYLILSIPVWGFASGINTLVSHFIGARKRQAVLPIVWKTSKISWLSTMLLSLPVVLFPEQLLYPLLGSSDMSLIRDSQPILYVLLLILSLFALGGVYFNGLAGTGATFFGLKLQSVCVLLYLAYIYIVVEWTKGGLLWAWSAEVFYWVIVLGVSMWYLASNRWHKLRM